jgi:hypothetical protein
MKTLFRRTRAVALVLLLTLGALSAHAESVLNANDLTAGALTAATPLDDFVLLARADKGVNIEAVDKARTADDGEVFNARIKLNGGGSAEFRAVQFQTKGPAQLVLYANSSSKTDPRVLKVVDAAGTVVAELPAPADDEAHAGRLTCSLPAAGTYFVYSASGGINLYQVVVK